MSFIVQHQQVLYRDNDDIPTKYIDMWGGDLEYDDRDDALDRHITTDQPTRVVEVVEADDEREGEVAE